MSKFNCTESVKVFVHFCQFHHWMYVIVPFHILEHVCHPSPCMHQGRCSVESGHFKCVCPPLFKGDVCESKISCNLSFLFFYQTLSVPNVCAKCLFNVFCFQLHSSTSMSHQALPQWCPVRGLVQRIQWLSFEMEPRLIALPVHLQTWLLGLKLRRYK